MYLQPIINNALPNAQFQLFWNYGDSSGYYTNNTHHQYNSFGSFELCVFAWDTVNNCFGGYCDTITLDSVGNFSRSTSLSNTKPGFSTQILPPIINYQNTTNLTLTLEIPFKIYPNPTTGQVFIQHHLEAIQIKVTDKLGRIILQERTNSPQTTLNLEHFPKGLYFISISNQNKIYKKKIIKQ